MKQITAIFIFFMVINQTAFATPKIVLNALLTNQVMLQVNGKYRSIKVGKSSPEGIKLISASSKKAVIEVEGKRLTLDLSRHKSSSSFYRASGKDIEINAANSIAKSNKKNRKNKKVIIRRGGHGHFRVKGQINGKNISFLIDTGATSISISEAFANKIRLNKSKNKQYGYANTANGRVRVYSVKLARVKIKNLELRGIRAVVLPVLNGDALLGMSFLKRLNMNINGNIMTLSKKY